MTDPAFGQTAVRSRDEAPCHPVTSMCPECLRGIPGEVVPTRECVVMRKSCSEHGAFECVVSSDLEAYERMRHSPRITRLPEQFAMPEATGCPDDCIPPSSLP